MKLLQNVYNSVRMYIDEQDIRASWIERDLGTQKEKVSLLRKICIKEDICNFYDLGANYGEFSSVISDNVEKVFAFEPNPMVFKCLNRTFSEFHDNTICYQQAVDITSSEKDFYFNSKYSGGGRLNKWEWKDGRYEEFNKEEYYQSSKVTCIRFAEFFKKNNQNKNCLIKIDIEGLETKIIEDLSKNLEGIDTWFIYFETNNKKEVDWSKLPGDILVEHPHDILIGRIGTLKKEVK
jgi:FkbM family methyltransferase